MLPGLRASVADAKAKSAATRARTAAEFEPAETDPVARVLVDVPLAHLDRPFDYAVPAKFAVTAVPGARVKVRFAGQDVDGFVVERSATSAHTGRLQPLRRVVSPEPVLHPEVAALTASIAERYAGARGDVVRLAVPPRHARTEKEPSPPATIPAMTSPPDPHAWEHVTHGVTFLQHLSSGGSPRAVWNAAPGDDWPTMLAHAAAATLVGGRGSLICVPDQRDAERVSAAMTKVLGADQHVLLSADAGPAQRYRDFLAVSRGARRVVVGTRSAALAPVHDLGLVVVWDDGDDLHAEPRAPYPHVREMLVLRARQQKTAMLLAGFARTCEAEVLLRSGWANELVSPRTVIRERARVDIAPAEDRAVGSRIPRPAYEAIREGLRSGPVLVQTPRAGYAPSLACERCRTPARCATCAGPLVLAGPATPPTCRWCGTADHAWACRECGHRGLRAPVRGEARTAEELGRTFAGTTIRSSSGDRVLRRVSADPDIIVATIGAEPVAEGGYATVVILDTWLTLAREDLRAPEEALRRWLGAAGLVRPGGHVVAVGDPAHPVLQALVRWDPAGFAERELAERAAAHLPPAAALATITGEPGALDDALTLLSLPEVAEVLGPVPVTNESRATNDVRASTDARSARDEQRAVIRVPLASADALAAALGELQRVRSARKLDAVRIQVDPLTI